MNRLPAISIAMLSLGILVAVVGGSIATYVSISNTGSVKTIGLGVYSDSACTITVSSINWGAIEPGTTKNVTVYIRNEGTSSVTLSMSTSNWNPSSASSYISLSWNYGGQVVTPSQIVQVKLTLSISPSIVGITSFSFDITIAAVS